MLSIHIKKNIKLLSIFSILNQDVFTYRILCDCVFSYSISLSLLFVTICYNPDLSIIFSRSVQMPLYRWLSSWPTIRMLGSLRSPMSHQWLASISRAGPRQWDLSVTTRSHLSSEISVYCFLFSCVLSTLLCETCIHLSNKP